MLERIIIFVVLGVFVFSPSLRDWWRSDMSSWYEVYIPWLTLILVTIWLHWRSSRQGN